MMRKNILDQSTVDALIHRVHLLQITSHAKWGKMEVTEMLHHCYSANNQILAGALENKASSVKQRLLKFLFLYIWHQYPKNIKGPERINPKNSRITPDQFEAEKQIFIDTLHKFPGHTAPLEFTHPAFGKLNTRQWGVFTWMHMDHHLRQFGV